MKKSLFNFAATMLMSAGAVVFNACSDDNTDSDGGVGTLEVTPASLETIADYGGSFSFDVRSNSYWHVSVEDADELPLDWASADIVSGMGNASVNLSVETNDGQTVRTGRIVFELQVHSQFFGTASAETNPNPKRNRPFRSDVAFILTINADFSQSSPPQPVVAKRPL